MSYRRTAFTLFGAAIGAGVGAVVAIVVGILLTAFACAATLGERKGIGTWSDYILWGGILLGGGIGGLIGAGARPGTPVQERTHRLFLAVIACCIGGAAACAMMGVGLRWFAGSVDAFSALVTGADRGAGLVVVWGACGLVVGGGIGAGTGFLAAGRKSVGLALVALMGAMPMGAAILGAGYGRPDALFADQPSSTSGPGGEKAASPAAQGPPALPSGAIDKTAALRDCRAAYYTLRLADALAACERAVQADPLFIDARLDLGWVLLESGRTDDALVKAMTTEPLASTDAQRREALVLQVAVHTVRGEVVLAMAKLDRATGLGGKKGMEAGARLGVLRKGRVSEAWMRHILPRYACWAKKGDREAGEYLLRRGVTDRRMFLRALGKLDPAQREKLEGEGRSRCPW